MSPLPKTRARFGSKCAGCGDDIEEGDLVVRLPDEEGGDWVCETCGEEADPQEELL